VGWFVENVLLAGSKGSIRKSYSFRKFERVRGKGLA